MSVYSYEQLNFKAITNQMRFNFVYVCLVWTITHCKTAGYGYQIKGFGEKNTNKLMYKTLFLKYFWMIIYYKHCKLRNGCKNNFRWDCCVLRPNYPYFLAGQVFAFATLLYGTNLGLTTVCQPFILFGTILMPEDCNDVYYDFK